MKYLVQKTFRHASGALARGVKIQVSPRDSEVVVENGYTSELGLLSVYLAPGTYDWRALGARIPFDVESPGGGGGGEGSVGVELFQSTPATPWSFSVPASFAGRRPNVAVYNALGERWYPPTDVSPTLVLINYPDPETGSVVLT